MEPTGGRQTATDLSSQGTSLEIGEGGGSSSGGGRRTPETAHSAAARRTNESEDAGIRAQGRAYKPHGSCKDGQAQDERPVLEMARLDGVPSAAGCWDVGVEGLYCRRSNGCNNNNNNTRRSRRHRRLAIINRLRDQGNLSAPWCGECTEIALFKRRRQTVKQ